MSSMADELFGSGIPPGGDVQRLQADALGDPGQRRFRIMAIIDNETHIVWMEKQQLQALGMAIEQLLEQVPEDEEIVIGAESPLDFDETTRHQFRVGRIELGYDVTRGRVVISTFDIQLEDEGAPATLVLRLDLRQSAELSADAATIVAAGRPFCPMCGQPMDPEGHVCPQQNGHLPLSLDDSDLFEDL
jgi:uncharacterized repeat protein (TIGR03847 family)